ncbi:unnamed protein product [Pylaiella littoralis]
MSECLVNRSAICKYRRTAFCTCDFELGSLKGQTSLLCGTTVLRGLAESWLCRENYVLSYETSYSHELYRSICHSGEGHRLGTAPPPEVGTNLSPLRCEASN